MNPTLVIAIAITSISLISCSKRTRVASSRIIFNRQLTSEWHQQEKAKIDAAVAELRVLGKWDECWWKFEKLGDYGWRDNMDCGDATHSSPCMSGGYTYSTQAFEKLKRGDLSHNARNTARESAQQQLILIRARQRQ